MMSISSQRVHVFLLNKNLNFSKKEAESKMKNLAHIFRETNLVLNLIYEYQTKSKAVMSWNSLELRKEKRVNFLS